MGPALLEVTNVETAYGLAMARRGVTFSVPQESIVTILGANGAGKTTILKTVAGVMDPQKGTVRLDGREIQGLDPDRVTRLCHKGRQSGEVASTAYRFTMAVGRGR